MNWQKDRYKLITITLSYCRALIRTIAHNEFKIQESLRYKFKIQVHVVTRTAKRTDDVILDVFSKLRTSSYKFTTCKTSSTSKDKT